ncbi:hypothetical protein KGM_202859 [Danaus plexippus plexippus]|uniref:Uncharacterized protein n=1 Tax=Danaus plexippus plexippus TaxID=278856 RepID=A0A212F209_DANPL|nr:hypothetical protein KGM_202859 [Danaus plexippus plexippus]
MTNVVRSSDNHLMLEHFYTAPTSSHQHRTCVFMLPMHVQGDDSLFNKQEEQQQVANDDEQLCTIKEALS